MALQEKSNGLAVLTQACLVMLFQHHQASSLSPFSWVVVKVVSDVHKKPHVTLSLAMHHSPVDLDKDGAPVTLTVPLPRAFGGQLGRVDHPIDGRLRHGVLLLQELDGLPQLVQLRVLRERRCELSVTSRQWADLIQAALSTGL